jgi:hypothetical protein
MGRKWGTLVVYGVLLVQVIADLDQHGDAFRVTRLVRRRSVSTRSEFLGIAVSQD